MDLLEQLKGIVDLPTLPTTVVKVLRVVGRENTGAADLAKVITADQALAAKILQVANSAFYGLPRKVSDIERAVALLGFREVRDISLGVSVFDSLYLPTKGAYWNRAKFWEHCFVVGYLTRELAKARAGSDGGNAFAAGLLHDIGKVILDRYFSDVFRQILEKVDVEQARYWRVESEQLGTGHDVIGGYLLGVWNLPDDLVAGVTGHHRPQEEEEEMATWVYVANNLAHIAGFTAMPSEPDCAMEDFLAAPETVALKQAGKLPGDTLLHNLLTLLDEQAEQLSAEAAMLF